MDISDFLDMLEERRLVSVTIVARLREKAAEEGQRLTAKAVLKYLVKKELIDRQAARELLQTTLTVSPSAESSILGHVVVPEPPVETQENLGLVTEEEIPTLSPVDSRQNLRLEEIDAPMGETSSIFEDSQTSPALSSGRLSALASFSSKAREESAVEELLAEKAAATRPPKTKSKKKKDRSKNEWDSGLILYGGGGLLVLMIAGAAIYYLLNRENADVVLEEATNYFEGGSYTQAIGQYQKFVVTFPGHPQHSAATVKLGLARLWKDTSTASNFVGALRTARSVLEDIEDEADFRSAQRDLASLLPKIAKGLATQAEETTDLEVAAERVEQTRDALSLCMNTKYIPKEFRDEVLLDEVEQSLLRVERNRVQGQDLAKALKAIQAALDTRDIGAAYNLRNLLLEQHPALINDKSLTDKVAEISSVEVEVVEFVAESKDAVQGDRPSPLVASLTLAERSERGTADAQGNLAVRVGGAIFGLQASDGAVLWRHYVGSDPRLAPMRLANGDLLFTDSVHQELVRMEGSSGKSIWRLPLEGKSFQPVIAGEQAYVAQPDGKMLLVNLATGQQTGVIKFGQGLATPPVIDESSRRLYLLGEHSSLYTISTDDNSCLGVYYLGHNAGSIHVPPTKVLNKLIIAINAGLSTSHLIVLQTNEQGLPEVKDLNRRLTGTVDTPLLVDGRRLVAITSLGQISVFDVASASGKAALSAIAVRDAEKGSSLARFAMLHDGSIWIGDKQLNKLAIQATGNSIRLSNLEDDFAGATFNHPLQVIGNVVIHVRRGADQAGSIVAATNTTSGQTVWQTELAVPLAGAPVIDPVGARIAAVTTSGAAFQLDREALARRIQDRAERSSSSRRGMPIFTESTSLGEGRIVAGEIGSPTLLHYRPGAPRGELKSLKLPGELTSELVAWRNGFLAPTHVGQVYFLNADDGEQLATPFQPPLEANTRYRWLTPAVYGTAENSQFVLSDGNEQIYLVTLAADPQPHLEVAAETPLGSTVLNTRLAVNGEVAVAGTDAGALAIFKLPTLESATPLDVGGQITWGPFPAGDGFLFVTDADELVFVTGAGEVGWRIPLEDKQPAGTPLIDGDAAFVAWQLHGISRVNLADGTFSATTPLEQAIVAGPIPYATRLILAAADGTLLVINRP